ncbi:SusC/RagA family TonB-linked outer membrane protein, partial [Pseudoxanthomonas sp. SGD-10]
MKKYTLSFFTFLFCTLQIAIGQNRTVSGVVSDSGGPLAGAFVFEKNNQSNAVTVGVDGQYSITLRGSSNILVFQMFGLLTQEVNVAGRSTVNVVMEPDVKGLEEVSVIAYGTKSRVTQTGATSQISGAEIRQNPSASLQNTLMGRLPGFISQQRSGQPGSDAATFSIRGANSFTGTVSALVIVDDIEYGQPL